MQQEDRDIREHISEAYARALNRSRDRSSYSSASIPEAKRPYCASTTPTCCDPMCCEQPSTPMTVAAQYAGYGKEERENYAEAAASSFGCGNPLAFAGVRPGQTVLDLGSGAGFDLLIAAQKVGPTGRVIGVDMTADMVDAAKRNAARAGLASIVEVRLGHIENLPVDNCSVDWVISNCVINLSPNKHAVFHEISRVLKPGGRFSVSDIVCEELPDWLLEHRDAYAACIAGAIPEGEYLAGLRDAGLYGVKVTERYMYEESQIRAMIANDLEAFKLDDGLVNRGLVEVEGKVASIKVTGHR